jgi:hypothetical protein
MNFDQSTGVLVEFPRLPQEDLNLRTAVRYLRAEIANLDEAISALEKISRVQGLSGGSVKRMPRSMIR